MQSPGQERPKPESRAIANFRVSCGSRPEPAEAGTELGMRLGRFPPWSAKQFFLCRQSKTEPRFPMWCAADSPAAL